MQFRIERRKIMRMSFRRRKKKKKKKRRRM
jgi:hypothetical protein